MKYFSIVLLAVAFAGCAVARPGEGGGYYAPPVNVGIGPEAGHGAAADSAVEALASVSSSSSAAPSQSRCCARSCGNVIRFELLADTS